MLEASCKPIQNLWNLFSSVLMAFYKKIVIMSFISQFAFADRGEAYTWGWKECIPSEKVLHDSIGKRFENDSLGKQSLSLTEQGDFN